MNTKNKNKNIDTHKKKYFKKNNKKMKNNKNNKNQTNNCTKQAWLCMLKEKAAVVLVLRLPGGFLLPKSIDPI